MPGFISNPEIAGETASWSLRTSRNQIPYKLVEQSGSFEGFEGESTAISGYLIRASDLLGFVNELFPEPLVVENQLIQRTSLMPGTTFLFARRLRWRAFMDGLPIDPFNSHPGAPSQTYHPIIRVDVEFLAKNEQEETTDPTTFLEITGDPNGEFLHTESSAGKWICDRTGSPGIDSETNKSPIIPVVMQVPTVDWSLRWPRVGANYFKNTLLPQLRKTMGLVNSKVVPLLFDAERETLLFNGYRYREVYSIVGNNLGTIQREKFITLDLKMTEKRIDDPGSGCPTTPGGPQADVIRGHNDFWRPNIGWQRLLRHPSNLPVYASIDFNTIFNPPVPPAP